MWEAGALNSVSLLHLQQVGALTLGGCMWSLIDLYAVGFTGAPSDFVVLQVGDPFAHCAH